MSKLGEHGKKALLAALLVSLSFGWAASLNPSQATALSGSDFQAGRIIDDLVFFNRGSLSVSQIQDFLNAKVPTCDTNGTQPYAGTTAGAYGTSKGYPPPYTCLKDYRIDTSARSAESGLCDGYIASNQSAAEVIYSVAQSCGVNPEVLLVLLQKEQGLITDDWPWSIQYRSATGFGCPDSAACDSQYYGFFNQVYAAARQFKKYALLPNNYNYLANRNNFIAYNPDSSCGGSTIFIQNQATAGLYNYTPYQPNAGALASMSDSTAGGTAACGAYGNRNFFWYFTKWFGPTLRSLITAPGVGVYLVENGAKHPFLDGITFLSYSYKWSDVLSVSKEEMDSIPDGAPVPYNTHYRDGRLVTTDGNSVYLVENGAKRIFPNGVVFSSYSWAKWSNIVPISSLELSQIPDGAAMFYNVHYRDGRLVTTDGNSVYLVENGAKRIFPNGATFSSYGYKWADILTITTLEASYIPDGAAMPPKQ
jgi:hypothetical protein